MSTKLTVARKVTSILAAIIIVFLLAASCKKDNKEKCLKCNAECPADPSVGELEYCGDDLDAQEANFRAEHPGCTVTCTRS